MKKIIAIASLVLMFAVCLTSCGGKKDYEAGSKDFTFDCLTITLTESFDVQREIDANQDKTYIFHGDYITYTSASGTSVTIERLEPNGDVRELAESDLVKTKGLDLNCKILEINEGENDEKYFKTGKTVQKTENGPVFTYCYYVFTVYDKSGSYTYLKAFFNEGIYSYSVCLSTTESAYYGDTKRPEKDPGYQEYFINWLNSVNIAIPQSQT